jgi:hypothetical protein
VSLYNCVRISPHLTHRLRCTAEHLLTPPITTWNSSLGVWQLVSVQSFTLVTRLCEEAAEVLQRCKMCMAFFTPCSSISAAMQLRRLGVCGCSRIAGLLALTCVTC